MLVARALAFAAFGLVIGSFLTVVIHRVPRRQSIVAPRSACPSCHTQITARDNVPVFSYLLLRGRCRHCGTRISAEYPAVEALTAALFVARIPVLDGRVLDLGVIQGKKFDYCRGQLMLVAHRDIPRYFFTRSG